MKLDGWESEPHYDWGYTYELFSELKGKGRPSVLDVGCGDGRRATFIQDLVSDLIGLEISVESAKKAAKKKDICVVIGDGNSLPFRDNSFDAIVSNQVIEHIINDCKFLKEIFRVLKEGGFVIITTPNRLRITSAISNICRILKLSNNKFPMNPDHVREYTKEELRNLLEITGFSEYDVTPVYLGLMTRFFGKPIDIGFKNIPKKFSKYANQLIVCAKK